MVTLQKYFGFSDGEKLVGAIAIDPLSLPEIPDSIPIEDPDHSPPYGVAITKGIAWFASQCRAKDITTKRATL